MKIPFRPRRGLAAASRPIAAALALSAGVLACNAFDPLSSPSGDDQLLSAARACLDRGDFECALDHYGKLSADKADVKASEQAYAILAQNNAGFTAFATAFGTDPSVKGLGALVTEVADGAGESRRLALHGAYLLANSIPEATNPKLRGLARFLTATALAAEILAEISGSDRVLHKVDLVANGSCGNTTEVGCAASAACDAGLGSIGSSGTNGDIDAAAPSGTPPTLDQLYTALSAAVSGLSAVNPSGSAVTSFGGLLPVSGKPSVVNAGTAPIETGSRCFRRALLAQGLGV